MNMHDMQMQEGAGSEPGGRHRQREAGLEPAAPAPRGPLAPAVWSSGTMSNRSCGTAGDTAEPAARAVGPLGAVLVGQGEAREHLGLSSCPRIDLPVPPLGDDLSKGSRDAPGHQQPAGALSPAPQRLPVQGLIARCGFGPRVIPDLQLGELCQTDQKAPSHRPNSSNSV